MCHAPPGVGEWRATRNGTPGTARDLQRLRPLGGTGVAGASGRAALGRRGDDPCVEESGWSVGDLEDLEIT